MKEMQRDEKGFYVAQLTITILSRDEDICNRALDTISYAADCVDNEYPDTVIINEHDVNELDEVGMREKLNEFDIESYLIGLDG